MALAQYLAKFPLTTNIKSTVFIQSQTIRTGLQISKRLRKNISIIFRKLDISVTDCIFI